MKIFITGSTGFTGGHLARTLVSQGHELRALVRDGADTSGLTHPGIEVVAGQLTSKDDVRKVMEGCEKAYHIAAVFRTAGHPDSYYRDVNVGGTVNVLESAQELGLERVIHCSTGGVHGHIADPPCTEESPYNPGDIYQDTKLEAEQQVMAAADRGQRVSVFRPAPIYGPGDLRLLKLFRAVHSKQFRMIGKGEVHFHMVYIDDLVDGIIRCGTSDAALGEIFLLAGPETISLKDLVERLAQVLGVPGGPKRTIPVWPVMAAAALCEMVCIPLRVDPPLYRRRVGFFTKHREFDCSKAKELIGYAPKFGVDEGLANTARWYVEHGHLPRGAMPAVA